MTKKNILIEKWAIKYAEIKNYDKDTIISLFRDDALNVKTVKAELIRHDMNRVLETTTLSKTQAKMAVAKEYGVTKSHVETVVYNKNIKESNTFRCEKCGAEMSRYKYTKNKGICDYCIIKEAGVNI